MTTHARMRLNGTPPWCAPQGVASDGGLRVRGSHHIFRREGVRELINLQRDGSQAKPYQVRQVRQAILRNHL